MRVNLISYTCPSPNTFEQGIETPEDLIAYCARVSNPSNQLNKNAYQLVKYLMEHKHWSPLEMVDITLEINTTRDIARQILRHRSFVFQEFSQRYADPTQLEFTVREARLQDETNRQNSIEVEDEDLQKDWMDAQTDVLELARQTYSWALEEGIAKEVARSVLPEGMTNSRLYMKGSLRSWIHYIELRLGEETQKEHREIAEECSLAIVPLFPLIVEMYEEK